MLSCCHAPAGNTVVAHHTKKARLSKESAQARLQQAVRATLWSWAQVGKLNATPQRT